MHPRTLWPALAAGALSLPLAPAATPAVAAPAAARAAAVPAVAVPVAAVPGVAAGGSPVGPAGAGVEPPAALVAALGRDLGLAPAAARARLAAEARAQRLAAALPAGPGVAGRWYDAATGDLVVAVSDAGTAAAVRALGARPVTAARSRAELDELTSAVRDIVGDGEGVTGWGADPATGRVTVRVDRQTRTAATAALLDRLRPLGDAITIVAVDGAPVQQGGAVQPGSPWWPGGETNCSIGFPATDADGGKHFLTAGHCTNDRDQPAYGQSGKQNRIGTSNAGGSRSVNAREGDMGVVAVTEADWTLSAAVNTWGGPAVAVTGSVEPLTGRSVCHSGNTSKWRCGTVTAVDQTVDYGTLRIEGLAYTTACSMGGDSGGAWLAGDKAVGLHSGGRSSCSPGGADDQSILQPVNESLKKWNLTLVTAAP
ncbi:serine protease [Pilimelia anulata]|uniref:Serine protease n=1 Tax=Pilimelia anulata TaxID=53371 RepID=A0A8J3FE63_9ACTN|nr:S1 family peptidase [Pilimelia anulata]GGK07145.1 serine protease [Pilimelia anulata]